MAAKKKHYYVLVITDEGPKFVTDICFGNRTAKWDYKEKPLELDKSRAEDLVLGLNLNFHQSYVVVMNWELDSQPYRYEKWKMEWKARKEPEEAQ